MKPYVKSEKTQLPLKRMLFAGLCGGLAEILWVAFYSYLTPVNGIEVARQVTASVFPMAASSSLASMLGVLIHLALSLMLALGFVYALWAPFVRRRGTAETMVSAIAVLIGVWAANFFIILPVLNPAFVTLMPYSATLVSKALFGIAMAGALQGTSGQKAGANTFPSVVS